MKKLTLLFPLLATFTLVKAQTPNGSVASVRNIRQNLPPHTASFNANFTQIYNKSAVGLNYASATIKTTTRPTWEAGSGFPATLSVSGIPSTAKIDAAFLYAGVSYTEATAPLTIIDTIKNPLNNVTTYTDSLIGTSTPVCWGETGSATYRCLVNTCITGNGTYVVNLSGLANPAWEVDGFTLFIAYIDTAASYTGNLAFNDGAHEYSGTSFDTTLGGFTGCSSPSSYAQAFVLAGDIQSNVGAYAISSLNGSVDTFARNFWDLYTGCITVAANQTSARFSMDTANNSDCILINMYGLYFQSCSVNTPACYIYNNGDTTHLTPCSGATAPYICYVTADTSSHDEVVWQKTGIDTNVVDSILIYRAVTNTIYMKVGEVSVHGYTDFIDYSANSNVTSYIYLLGAKDSCGDSLSTGVYHQSVFLQTGVGLYGHINLSWNPYVGNYVDYYRILRDDSGMGHWQVIDSVPGVVNAWTDLTPPNNSGLRYMVNTGWNIACSPNLSYSNARIYKAAVFARNISYSNISVPYPNGVPQYFNNESISIYPNPVKDVLEVAISQKIDGDITVTNVLGQQVYEGKISTGGGTTIAKIDMSGLPDGIYIFSLQSGSQRLEKKVIKM